MAAPTAAKDGHTLTENVVTQPLVRHRVFNNPEVISTGWYPLCPASALRRGTARSFVIFKQRVVAFRGEDGVARALDAFCPHMGADLANGSVEGDEIECYFHRWRFDGAGELTQIPCQPSLPKGVRTNAYPTEDKYGYIWVYAGGEAPHPVPSPPGLEGLDLSAIQIATPTLYAHHHVMMAGGIDLQHFSSVHNLDVAFEYEASSASSTVFDWDVAGPLPERGLKNRVYRWLVGPNIGYQARFDGGSIVALTYGPSQRFRGSGFKWPPLHILWGCLPLTSGVSQVFVFLVTKKRPGVLGWLKSRALLLLTAALLVVLRDDDVKAFPHMRFNPKHLVEADRSVARLIQLINTLPISPWSGVEPD